VVAPSDSEAAQAVSIDPSTGSVLFDGRLALFDGMSLEQARRDLWDSLLIARDVGTGWVWLDLRGLNFGGWNCALAAGFHDSRLENLHWEISRECQLTIYGVPSNDEFAERMRVMRETLQAQLARRFDVGVPEKFSWGQAYCVYDYHNDMPGSGVQYDSENRSI
jgi:hypothetical protein